MPFGYCALHEPKPKTPMRHGKHGKHGRNHSGTAHPVGRNKHSALRRTPDKPCKSHGTHGIHGRKKFRSSHVGRNKRSALRRTPGKPCKSHGIHGRKHSGAAPQRSRTVSLPAARGPRDRPRSTAGSVASSPPFQHSAQCPSVIAPYMNRNPKQPLTNCPETVDHYKPQCATENTESTDAIIREPLTP